MRITALAGTRPEVVKMAPVIKRLKAVKGIETIVCATGQHREMLAQAFADFNLEQDINLDVMTQSQSLGQLSAALFQTFDKFLERERPDWILVQGDTASAMVAGLCAFYRGVRLGHVEAGLRSFDLRQPFPEELNRKIIALTADAHFAPTEGARANLLAEGAADDAILVTGNTVVDALRDALAESGYQDLRSEIRDFAESFSRLVLVTAHRRENLGAPLERICEALARLAAARGDVGFIYPVHLNPAVRNTASLRLGDIANIMLTPPLPYKELLQLLARCDLALTDSGGVQEEAAVLRKPALVMRETTERMEGVRAGAALLTGTDIRAIMENTLAIIDNPEKAGAMSRAGGELYGDGKAASRIAEYFSRKL